MKIKDIISLDIPSIKVVQYQRFRDHRGYFTETYQKNQLTQVLGTGDIVQINESHSVPHVFRGLHFQWNPYMGKFIRVIDGCMIDIILGIRRGSPTYGCILPIYLTADFYTHDIVSWVWVPPGFAHGNLFLRPTTIEYLCTGSYNSECEGAISLFSDFDWRLCNPSEEKMIKFWLENKQKILSDKDLNAVDFKKWKESEEAKHFSYDLMVDLNYV